MGEGDGFPTTAFFDRLGRRLQHDAEFAVHGRFLDLVLGFVSDDRASRVRFADGRLASCEDVPATGPADVIFRGTAEDWGGFLRERPEPGYVDVIGMDRLRPSFSIEGDRVLFARHLRALSRLLRLAQLEAAGVTS